MEGYGKAVVFVRSAEKDCASAHVLDGAVGLEAAAAEMLLAQVNLPLREYMRSPAAGTAQPAVDWLEAAEAVRYKSLATLLSLHGSGD